jgi:hypothetical protein
MILMVVALGTLVLVALLLMATNQAVKQHLAALTTQQAAHLLVMNRLVIVTAVARGQTILKVALAMMNQPVAQQVVALRIFQVVVVIIQHVLGMVQAVMEAVHAQAMVMKVVATLLLIGLHVQAAEAAAV